VARRYEQRRLDVKTAVEAATLNLGPDACRSFNSAASKEWLETNGLGGFAGSSISGMNTRRYHGLLFAAVRPPTERKLLLSKLEETLVVGGQRFELSTNQYSGAVHPEGYRWLTGFDPLPFPTWTFDCGGVRFEKSICMIHGENTTVIQYKLLTKQGTQVQLEVRPLIAFRDYHALTHENDGLNPEVKVTSCGAEVTPYDGMPTLYLGHDARSVDTAGFWFRGFEYAIERDRGLDFREDLYSPLGLTFDLGARPTATVIASTKARPAADAQELLDAEVARRAGLVEKAGDNTLVQALTRAADQFIVARGDGQTIIAGYPWFTDWSRDTMISLPGLTLATGRFTEARSILANFAGFADRGMLPNRFPDRGEEPEYNTVDGTLWYFAAIDDYARHTGDFGFVRDELYGVLADIIDWHVKGTRYGIVMDADGLLRSGEVGVQLTWMDARVGTWVVTPRHGKPVEIQALWYNALKFMEELAARFSDAAASERYGMMAVAAMTSFNAKFWNAEAGCLYDVLSDDGPDASIRPNQALALSLPRSMVEHERAAKILDVIERDLLTPVGLRTLAPSDPLYRPRYEGDPGTRDSGYHQGTVWPWLVGPYLEGYLRTYNSSDAAKAYVSTWLEEFLTHLQDACIGQVSEIYDAEPPRRPAGCPAQAWSVAEILRIATLVSEPGAE
jgi:predicted glycogen debranching enzyme